MGGRGDWEGWDGGCDGGGDVGGHSGKTDVFFFGGSSNLLEDAMG